MDTTQLDPTVQALTQSIGQQESGVNYNLPGKSGEYGAYQMTPAIVQQYSPKILGSSYSDATKLNPDQQNQLAYGIMNQWGSTGDPKHAALGKLTPAQIASDWNSGDPNAYLDPSYKGVNSHVATYDVPAYVKSIEQKYANNISKLAPQESQSSTQNNQPNIGEDLLAGGAAMANYVATHAKSLLGTAVGGTAVIGGLASGNPLAVAAGAGDVAANVGGLFSSGASGSTPSYANQNTPSNSDPLALLTSMDNANKNSQKLAQVYNESMGATQGNSNFAKDPIAQAGIQANAAFGLAPEIDKNGRQDYTKAIQKSQGIVNSLSGQIQGIISTEGSEGNFEDSRQEAKSIVRQRVPETEWETADKHIDEGINTYMKNSGASVKKPTASLSRFDKMRSETGAGKKWGLLDTSTKKEAYKALSIAARKQVEKHTKNKDLYNATMKMESHLLNGQKIMKKLHGKKAIKHEGILKSLLKGFGNIGGAYIGDKIGGTTGSILGYLFENRVAKAVDKKFGATIFQTAGMKKAMKELQSKSPHAYAALSEQLKANEPSIEKIIENKEGWKPGFKAKFDTALMEKNKKEVKRLLPEVPPKYKEEFKDKISGLLNSTGPISPNKKANKNQNTKGEKPS